MEKLELPKIQVIGISLKSKTTNKNGQSKIECGNLWQKSEKEGLTNKIENKLGEEIFAVYYNYEGDHTKPFSYFIGCKVADGTKVPDNLESLIIPKGTFIKKIAKGKMRDCIADAWKEIWQSDLHRAYHKDFEVYDERSKDWSNAEVDIYVSTK